ncbi:hypothetical protein SPI_00934 [Niveomyces insectorum RCEF 264]|uniref:BTB domain-containing protein n=1 Tax=Niveomyces insectorum RCEF 264 TaxID=1081102 RepID=A0A162MQY2_9HYPO|nr:hypothetical protein SPI_00934 [Niveomyces insectorum RCEF 264]
MNDSHYPLPCKEVTANTYHADLIRVLVGPDQREFVLPRALLCASSPFFRDSIDAVPEGLTTTTSTPTTALVSPASSASSTPTSASTSPAFSSQAPLAIWLSGESAGMFELFVLWLYRHYDFRPVVDKAVTILVAKCGGDEPIDLCAPSSSQNTFASQSCRELHWNLVHLHLFAAMIDVPALQDVVMDSLQDLYLRFDWDATPALLRFLYVESEPFAAFRLRKWAVALLAWTLSNRGPLVSRVSRVSRVSQTATGGDDDTAELRRLLDEAPQLRADYDAHRAKLVASRADARIKNPQLRIPSNHLRREDRHFGFRQCSFHSHRRVVGEGRCPHHGAVARSRAYSATTAAATVAAGVTPAAATASPQAAVHYRKAHSASSSLSSTVSSIRSEPRVVDLPMWSPRSVITPGVRSLGMELTI